MLDCLIESLTGDDLAIPPNSPTKRAKRARQLPGSVAIFTCIANKDVGHWSPHSQAYSLDTLITHGGFTADAEQLIRPSDVHITANNTNRAGVRQDNTVSSQFAFSGRDVLNQCVF